MDPPRGFNLWETRKEGPSRDESRGNSSQICHKLAPLLDPLSRSFAPCQVPGPATGRGLHDRTTRKEKQSQTNGLDGNNQETKKRKLASSLLRGWYVTYTHLHITYQTRKDTERSPQVVRWIAESTLLRYRSGSENGEREEAESEAREREAYRAISLPHSMMTQKKHRLAARSTARHHLRSSPFSTAV